jgi:hypothetical protein
VIHDGYKFEAIDVDGVKVEQLLITRLAEPTAVAKDDTNIVP